MKIYFAFLFGMLVWATGVRGSDNRPVSNPKSIAVLGDSLSTGAVVSPRLSLDPDQFWAILLGKQQVEKTQTAAVVNTRHRGDVYHPLIRVFDEYVSVISSYFINDEGASWGALLGAKLGIPQEDTYVYAKNGAKISGLLPQVKALLGDREGFIPEVTAVLFTGNDVCSALSVLHTPSESYEAFVRAGLRLLFQGGKPSSETGTVLFLQHLNLTQLVKSEEIGKKNVPSFGGTSTCQELVKRGFLPPEGYMPKTAEAVMSLSVIPPTPARLCPGVYAARNEDFSHLDSIATRVRGYRRAVSSVAREINSLLKKGDFPGFERWEVTVVSESADLEFKAGDIANDCFHLSKEGQKKLADTAFDAFQKRPQ